MNSHVNQVAFEEDDCQNPVDSMWSEMNEEHESSVKNSQETFNQLWQNIVKDEPGNNYTHIIPRGSVILAGDENDDPRGPSSLEFDVASYTVDLPVGSQEGFDDLISYMRENSETPADFRLTGQSQEEPQQVQPENRVSSTTPQPLAPVPSTVNYLGDYNFTVGFEPQNTRATKSTAWTYSETLDQLYVGLGKLCPIRVMTSPPPPGCTIRAVLIYSQPDQAMEVVSRCPAHVLGTDLSNKDKSVPCSHVVRCGQVDARYEVCPSTGIHSVRVPYRPPEAGTEFSSYYFSFMCLTSCVGGLNRRRTHLIFTLEHNNAVIGRRAIRLRVCACPGRDKKSDEEKFAKRRPLSRQNSGTSGPSTRTVVSNFDQVVTAPASKRQRREEPASGGYTINIKTKEDYDVILPLVLALEKAREVGTSHRSSLSSKVVRRRKANRPPTDEFFDD